MRPERATHEAASGMTRGRTILFAVTLGVIVVVGGLVLINQRLQSAALRIELDQVRTQAGELAQLRVENQRLRELQISDADLAALRSDHAALPRLRSELEALKNTGPGAR